MARVARILKDLGRPRPAPGGTLRRALVLLPLIGSLVRRAPRA
ncbi:hypothetical protein GCM10023215_37670 [Pseudonocardia yuanmonensis]|uniref:Uncharacterized protein n=1 Tax=Pseudonocardia yuanmonensis TaxID=1095914 RepID=A0ABP8WY46_9PSEU